MAAAVAPGRGPPWVRCGVVWCGRQGAESCLLVYLEEPRLCQGPSKTTAKGRQGQTQTKPRRLPDIDGDDRRDRDDRDIPTSIRREVTTNRREVTTMQKQANNEQHRERRRLAPKRNFMKLTFH